MTYTDYKATPEMMERIWQKHCVRPWWAFWPIFITEMFHDEAPGAWRFVILTWRGGSFHFRYCCGQVCIFTFERGSNRYRPGFDKDGYLLEWPEKFHDMFRRIAENALHRHQQGDGI